MQRPCGKPVGQNGVSKEEIGAKPGESGDGQITEDLAGTCQGLGFSSE